MILFRSVTPPEDAEIITKKFAFLPTILFYSENQNQVREIIWLTHFYEKKKYIWSGRYLIYRQRHPFKEPLKAVK